MICVDALKAALAQDDRKRRRLEFVAGARVGVPGCAASGSSRPAASAHSIAPTSQRGGVHILLTPPASLSRVDDLFDNLDL